MAAGDEMRDVSERWEIGAVRDAAMRISDLARGSDLATPVGHLNRWKIRDVVAHLGGVHRWATQIMIERSRSVPGFKKSKLDGTELCDWFDEGARLLVDELRKTDFGEPCPTFNPGSDGNIEFWARRQAHESTVHRWDVERALDSTTKIEADLAVDGIDEFLDVFVRTRGKQTLESTLVLRTTSPSRTWTLTPATKPGRIDVAQGGPESTGNDLTQVLGEPESLLLALWGRLAASDAQLTITGDQAAAASLISI